MSDKQKNSPVPKGSGSEDRSPVRLGLLLDSLEVRVWVYEMLDSCLSDGTTVIPLIVVANHSDTVGSTRDIVSAQGHSKEGGSKRISLMRIWNALARRTADGLNRLYTQRDRSVESATTLRSITELLPEAQVIHVDTLNDGNAVTYPDEAIDEIKKQNLDVLFRGGFRILKGQILRASHYGVWSFHHGDNRYLRGGPPAFWEVMEGWPEVGSVLQVLNDNLDNGEVLYRTTGPVFPFSLHNTLNRHYWKSSVLFPRALRELCNYRDTFSQRIAARQKPPKFYSKPVYREASATQYLALSLKQAARKVRVSLGRRLKQEQWLLLYHLCDNAENLTPETALHRYRALTPPADRIWADPHVIARNGAFYVFFEEMLYSKMIGRLAVVCITKNGEISEPQVVLEKPYHMSYPGLIEHNGELWMVPETIMNDSVDLYRCVEFPHRWEFHSTLFSDVRMIDSTLIYDQNRWWLFANIETHRSMRGHGWDELHLFSTEDFLNPEWRPHPLNPIVSDLSCSRPAGPLYREQGKLYRPSQNCRYDYGYGFNISEIQTLTLDDYKETIIERITPNWQPNIVATHSIAHASIEGTTLSVVDALRETPRFGFKQPR